MTLIFFKAILLTEPSLWNWPGWPAIATITTVVYTLLTFILLRSTKRSIDIANENKDKANKLAEFQIYTKIADSLNINQAVELIDIIGDGWFDIEEISDRSRIVVESPPKKILKGTEIQRYILNPLEDLSKFKDDGLITINSINSGFGSLVLMISGSKLTIEYIKYQRTKVYNSNSIYLGIENLVEDVLKLCSEDELKNYTNYFKQ